MRSMHFKIVVSIGSKLNLSMLTLPKIWASPSFEKCINPFKSDEKQANGFFYNNFIFGYWDVNFPIYSRRNTSENRTRYSDLSYLLPGAKICWGRRLILSAWYLSPKSQTETLLNHMNLSWKFRWYTVRCAPLIFQITRFYSFDYSSQGFRTQSAVFSKDTLLAYLKECHFLWLHLGPDQL